MFTGIVTAIGTITRVEDGPVRRFTVETPWAPDGIAIGASIAHAGVCLTVVETAPAPGGGAHMVEVSPETLAKSTLGAWKEGSKVNLERSLKVGDELGGHIVTGHADGVGQVVDRRDENGWITLRFQAPASLAGFIAPKGSIAVDGVSLTVNAVHGADFTVMIIPHTAAVTTLGALQAGDSVNLEADLMARYAARLAGFDPGGSAP